MSYSERDPKIPTCPTPATHAVTYDPDGMGPRRLPYCGKHYILFTNTLDRRKVPYTVEFIHNEPCYAYVG